VLGFPIRTSSDHSSVDSSPRPIAASHVLHRLLMPRHPPCALKHLFTTRCSHPLCNTQHTTTPQPETTTTTPTQHPQPKPRAPPGCVRRNKPGAARQDPASRCLLRTQQRAEPFCEIFGHYVPPSHNTQPARRPTTRCVDLVKGEPTTFRVAGQPHHTVRTP
jgi:hypothetical protein